MGFDLSRRTQFYKLKQAVQYYLIFFLFQNNKRNIYEPYFHLFISFQTLSYFVAYLFDQSMELLQRHLVSTVVVLQIRSTERNNAIRSESQKRITRLFCFLDNIVFLYNDKEIENEDNESFFIVLFGL